MRRGGRSSAGDRLRPLEPGCYWRAPGGQGDVRTAARGPGLVAVDRFGDLYVADTARGAIWKVEFRNNGMLRSNTGCDETFTSNTLCMDNIWFTHPWLDGTDGFALDQAGNIWNSVNERNAIVIVTPAKEVIEFFRNDPDGMTDLRNEGPLETPTSPFLSGTTLCTTNSDGSRRDNRPSGPGEGRKINCLDQDLEHPGLPLPVGP